MDPVFWDRGLRNVVLCTHGEVIGRLLAELVAQGLVWRIGWTCPTVPLGCWSAPTEVRFTVACWPARAESLQLAGP
jgi:hypothetical protein